MSINPAVFRAMVDNGATPEMLLAVIEAEAAVEAQRREKQRSDSAERQRRFKAKHKNVNAQDNANNALPRVTSVTIPPNEYISNPPSFDVSNETSAVSDFADRVVETWNTETSGSPLPTARKLNLDRRKHLKARVREHGEQAVFEAIRNMAASEFHSGRSGKWMEGHLGWLLKSGENFQKMLERTNAQPPTAAPPSNLSILLDQAKRYAPRDQAA
jgi:hypothetical protein